MDFLQKFNDTFEELLKDLIRVFPDDVDFQMYSLGIKAAFMADSKIVYSVFRDHIMQYEDKILGRDESFFLSQDYDEYNDSNEADNIIKKLKGSWALLNDDNKEIIWRYFKVMVHLTKKIKD